MHKLLLGVATLCFCHFTTLEAATIIQFNGTITSVAADGDLAPPALSVGDGIVGVMTFDSTFVEVTLALGGAFAFTLEDGGLFLIPNGYHYVNWNEAYALGFDNFIDIALLRGGSGGIFVGGSNPDYSGGSIGTTGSQGYDGVLHITSIVSTPETGSTILFFGVALLPLIALRIRRRVRTTV
jgi:hypothetical protein